MALVLGACGEASLADVGQRSTNWIGDVEASSTTAVAATAPAVVESRVAALALTSAAGIDWVNDGLGITAGDDPESVAREVWRRSGRDEAYVQAHRADIAAVLPGVKFPGAIPASVEYATSQLVFEERTGRIDHDVAAAFGLWSIEPYTQSRAVGQRAVLLVGLNDAADASAELPSACDRVEAGDAIACRDISINGQDAAEVQVEGGVKFIWWDADYRYELFYRTDDDPDVGLLIAESMVELAHLEENAFDAYRGVAGRAPTR